MRNRRAYDTSVAAIGPSARGAPHLERELIDPANVMNSDMRRRDLAISRHGAVLIA
jgi:hypothetical protein